MPGGIDGVEYSKDVTNLNDKETSSKPPHPHNPKECDCSSIYEHTSLITSKVYEVNARVAAHSAGFAASAAYKVESDLMAVKAEYNIAKLEAQKAKLEAQKANDRVDSVLETLQSLERDTEATTEEAIEADNAAMASRNAADKAAAIWSGTPAPHRADILFKAHRIMQNRFDELAESITLEEGKCIGDAEAEVKRSLAVIEFMAGEGRRMHGYTAPSELQGTLDYTYRRPLGVVSVITPWNFPLAIPAWKIAPALVCGNTVVFKPAFSTPITAIKLVEVFEEAGIPKGVLNVVTGSSSDIGSHFVENEMIKGVSFTGSTEVGTEIYQMASKSLSKVQCEMGGKNAVIVMEDGDLVKAKESILQGAFGSSGQRCTATSRVIIQKNIFDDFVVFTFIVSANVPFVSLEPHQTQ